MFEGYPLKRRYADAKKKNVQHKIFYVEYRKDTGILQTFIFLRSPNPTTFCFFSIVIIIKKLSLSCLI